MLLIGRLDSSNDEQLTKIVYVRDSQVTPVFASGMCSCILCLLLAGAPYVLCLLLVCVHLRLLSSLTY